MSSLGSLTVRNAADGGRLLWISVRRERIRSAHTTALLAYDISAQLPLTAISFFISQISYAALGDPCSNVYHCGSTVFHVMKYTFHHLCTVYNSHQTDK